MSEQGGFVCYPITRIETVNISSTENVKFCDLTPINLVRLVELDDKKLPIGVFLNEHPSDSLKFKPNDEALSKLSYKLPTDFQDLKTYREAQEKKMLEHDELQKFMARVSTVEEKMNEKITAISLENKKMNEKLTAISLENKELKLENKKIKLENKKMNEKITVISLENKKMNEKMTTISLENKELKIENKELKLENKKMKDKLKEISDEILENSIRFKKELDSIRSEWKDQKKHVIQLTESHIRNTCNMNLIVLHGFLLEYLQHHKGFPNKELDDIFSEMHMFRNFLAHTKRPNETLLLYAGIDQETIDQLLKHYSEPEEFWAINFFEHFCNDMRAEFLSKTGMDTE